MKIIQEKVDGIYYQDILLSLSDIEKLKDGECVELPMYSDHKQYYVGVRLTKEERRNALEDWYVEEDD